jgi:hypothetical protein
MALKFGPTGKLPKGVHPATWDEIEKRLGFGFTRKQLLKGLLEGCRELRAVGVKKVYIDGSFATNKRAPNDFDCCYDLSGVDFNSLPAVFSDLLAGRAAQKARFGGEFFPSTHIATLGPPLEPYLTFFQHDRLGHPKGIVALDLDTLP